MDFMVIFTNRNWRALITPPRYLQIGQALCTVQNPSICGCVQCFKRSVTISGSLINKTRKYMWYKMMFLFQVSKTKGVGMEHTTTHSDLISLAEFQTKWGKSSHNKGVHNYCSGASLVIQGFLVKVVFTMARTNTLQVGDVVTQFLDGTDLLMQEVALNEVGHLSRKQESQVRVLHNSELPNY